MCHNIAKSSIYELYTILLSLARANGASGSLIRMRAWYGRLESLDVTKKPKKKISTYFSRVSLGEILRKFVYSMIWMLSSQYNFLRKF